MAERGKGLGALKTRVAEVFAGLRAAAVAAIGSRLFVAASATGALAFCAQAWTAPGRLPPFGALPLADLGLAPPLPRPVLLPEVQTQLDQAIAAGRPYAQDAFAGLWAGDPQLLAVLNIAGAGVCAALLAIGLVIQAAQARDPKTANRWWAARA
jgi:hypothetical protein